MIGNPIEHSLSPKIFNYIFRAKKINAQYFVNNIKSNKEFKNLLTITNKNFSGLNITLPYKKLAYEIIENIDQSAINVKSINCIKNINGVLKGYNTDQYGFIKMIDKSNISLDDYNILILGNGSSARTIAYTLLKKLNTNIFIWGRNDKKVIQLINDLNSHNNMFSFYNKKIDKPVIVINCISLNINKNGVKTILSCLPIKNIKLFIDLNYIETPLIKELRIKKIKVLLGLDMFIYQALKSFQIWFDGLYSNKILYDDIMKAIK